VSVGAAGEVEARLLHGRHTLHRATLVPPRQEIGGRDEHPIAILRGVFLPNHKQILRIAKWQRFEQHCVHDAEHAGVGAHTERQGKQRDHREGRSLPQPAKPVAQILPKKVHGLTG
jgi:hypothetical protein